MKNLFFTLCVIACLLSCNSGDQASNGENSNNPADKYSDTVSDSRGMRGTGSDNNGGTPGPGTITDTFQGQTDTADHTSQKTKEPSGK